MADKKRTVETINAEVNAIDAEIAKLRAKKVPLAAERAALLAEGEIQAVLAHMTSEQRKRIVLNPGVANGSGTAHK